MRLGDAMRMRVENISISLGGGLANGRIIEI